MRPLILVGHSLLGLALTMQGCGRMDESREGMSPRIGSPAQEIDGPDTDGTRFKLSDYRGKVVALSFWAGWCGPCKALIPHERALVEKYENRPFVLLGANADETPQEARQVMFNHGVTWRSWWAGPTSELATLTDRNRYDVRYYPTLFVIDAGGVIRYSGNDVNRADAIIEALVREAEAAPKKSAT
jgi:thiol-disulfide isomerase/thioredoxin